MGGVRSRDRVRERALRGVGAERKQKAVEKKIEGDKPETLGGKDEEESPTKRRRLDEGGESVGVRSKPTRKPVHATRTGPSSRIPAKRPIAEVVSIARTAFPQAPKPGSRTRPTPKLAPPAARGSHPPLTPPTTGPSPKSAVSKSSTPDSRHDTNN